jgi:hypothetical protein
LAPKRRRASGSLDNLRRQLGETSSPKSDPTATGRHPRQASKEKLVRVSVDLPRSQHKYLRDFAYDAETDGMSVVRGLLQLLREDPELAKRLQERLAGS